MNKKLIFLFIITFTFTFTFVSGKNLQHKIHFTLKLFDNFYISKLENINLPPIESASITMHRNQNYLTGGYIYNSNKLGVR